jgi:hypothetical protein
VSDRCFRVDELEEIGRLAGDDPRRGHLDECPRCRARWASVQAFLSPPDEPAGADLADARARLPGALRREIFGEASRGETDRRERHGRGAESGADSFVRRLRALRWPSLGPAFAAAVVLVVAVGIWRMLDPGGVEDQAPLLRRDGEVREDVIVGSEAHRLEDGRLSLSWTCTLEADSFVVLLYGSDLSELARHEAGPDPELVLAPSALVARDEGGAPVFWRAIGLRGGDEVARSPLRSLPAP